MRRLDLVDEFVRPRVMRREEGFTTFTISELSLDPKSGPDGVITLHFVRATHVDIGLIPLTSNWSDVDRPVHSGCAASTIAFNHDTNRWCFGLTHRKHPQRSN